MKETRISDCSSLSEEGAKKMKNDGRAEKKGEETRHSLREEMDTPTLVSGSAFEGFSSESSESLSGVQ